MYIILLYFQVLCSLVLMVCFDFLSFLGSFLLFINRYYSSCVFEYSHALHVLTFYSLTLKKKNSMKKKKNPNDRGLGSLTLLSLTALELWHCCIKKKISFSISIVFVLFFSTVM